MGNSAMKQPPTTGVPAWLFERRFTVAELERMTEAGLLLEDERFELIDGEVVPMSARGIRHEVLKLALMRRWAKLAPDDLLFLPETIFRLSEDTFLEPDFVVWPSGLSGASRFQPSLTEDLCALNGTTALLAVEIADSSLSYDLGRKAGVYARFGIRELWVINALHLSVHVHLEPDQALGSYRRTSNHGASETLTPEFAPSLTLRLADLNL